MRMQIQPLAPHMQLYSRAGSPAPSQALHLTALPHCPPWLPLSAPTLCRSNVVCVPRSHFMYPEMERMTTRFQEYPAEYFVEQSAAAKAKAAAAAAT